MSDGPHRTLPMRRHWKDTAERATKPVYSMSEVSEALLVSLKRDILEAPIKKVEEILNGRRPQLFTDRQTSAFRGMHEHYLREATATETINLRSRLGLVRRQLNCGDIANDLLSSERSPSPRSLQMPRHTGIDEGPERP